MSLPELYLSKPGVSFPKNLVDNAETIQRVRNKFKGTDQQFPKFETYREEIDGKYWFPTYTIANSTLHFKDSSPRIRLSVKYEDYKQFKSDVKITFDDPAAKPPEQKKQP